MNSKSIISLLKSDKLILSLLILSLISLLRTLIIPLHGDEITYFNITENILTNARYYFLDKPSTITPIIPLEMAIFKISSFPMLGFGLVKIVNILLTILGFRYLILFLKNQKVDPKLILSVLVLTAVNTNSIAWFSSMYPESILFFSFWGFIYYIDSELNINNYKNILIFFILLFMTRYVYAILGIPLLYYFYQLNKTTINKKSFYYSVLYLIPIFIWFKYVYLLEQNNQTDLSYFSRFKENGAFTNIKSGLGLLKHPEAGNINGLPAFISLFVPITGIRNFIVSIILIIVFVVGYYFKPNTKGIKYLFIATILTLTGFCVAGTGFSRYWLILLPSFYLGFIFFVQKLNINSNIILLCTKILAIMYVLNEIRLDIIIIKQYL